jgi:hypothetical protein
MRVFKPVINFIQFLFSEPFNIFIFFLSHNHPAVIICLGLYE